MIAPKGYFRSESLAGRHLSAPLGCKTRRSGKFRQVFRTARNVFVRLSSGEVPLETRGPWGVTNRYIHVRHGSCVTDSPKLSKFLFV